MEAPDLPMEIIEEIIKDVSFADLPACALICRSLVVPSQRALFRKVLLPVKTSYSEDINMYLKFHKALESNPVLAQYVQVFSVTADQEAKQLSFPQVLGSFRNLKELWLGLGCSYQALSVGVQEAFLVLLDLPTMVRLKLDGVYDLPPEVMIKMLSIPTICLDDVRFQLKQPHWDRELNKKRNNSSASYAIKRIVLGSQMMTSESRPLIECLSLPGVQLTEFAIRDDTGDIFQVELAQEVINKQCQFLTSLEFPSYLILDDGDTISIAHRAIFAHNLLSMLDEMNLLDIAKIPKLQSIWLCAAFSYGAFDEYIMVFSRAPKDNLIEKITIWMEFDKLEDISNPDLEHDWKGFDKLLSGPKFMKLKKVESRLGKEWFHRVTFNNGCAPPKIDGLRMTVINLLPMLHDSGKLDVDIELYDY